MDISASGLECFMFMLKLFVNQRFIIHIIVVRSCVTIFQGVFCVNLDFWRPQN